MADNVARRKTLKLGDSCLAVSTLQRILKDVGCFHGRITGDFDNATHASVHVLQAWMRARIQVRGVPNSGVVDERTMTGLVVYFKRNMFRLPKRYWPVETENPLQVQVVDEDLQLVTK